MLHTACENILITTPQFNLTMDARMNTLARLTLVVLIGLGYSVPMTALAALQVPAAPQVQSKDAQETSYLYVVRADMGIVTKINGGYTLSLQGIDDKVLYFSDRPVRQAGFISLAHFMADWVKGVNSFQVNPPNAAIVHGASEKNAQGIAQAMPVELSQPLVVSNGWLFQVKDLQGKMKAGTYQNVSVFIDNYKARTLPGVYITE